MKLRLTWKEFVSAAVDNLREAHPTIQGEPSFVRVGVEGPKQETDCESYEIPDLVYLDITGEGQ